MKRIRTLLIGLALLLAATAAFGQTYGSADYGAAGDGFLESSATAASFATTDFSQAGSGQVWDYSAFAPARQDSTDFVNPDDTPYRTGFITVCNVECNSCLAECLAACPTSPPSQALACASDCNAACPSAVDCAADCEQQWDDLVSFTLPSDLELNLGTITVEDLSSFYANDGAQLQITSIAGAFTVLGIPVNLRFDYTDPETVLEFPMAFNDTFADDSEVAIDFNSLGVNVVYAQTVSKTVTVEGEGQLITPFQTYDNVLKVRTLRDVTTDLTVLGEDLAPTTVQRLTYTWYSTASGYPLAEASGTIIGSVELIESFSYQDEPRCFEPVAVPVSALTADLVGSEVEVVFNNVSTGADTYLWAFGDGATSTEFAPTHAYTALGEYEVSLIATNTVCDPDESDTLAYTLRVVDGLTVVADFTPVPSAPCEGQAVLFLQGSDNADTYAWTFGDGATSTASNPTHTYASAGDYTVTLTATGAGGTDVATQTVTVGTDGVSAGSDQTITEGETAQLQATDNSGGSVFTWLPASSLSCSVCEAPIAAPATTTTYTVTVVNNCGVFSDQVTITVEPPTVTWDGSVWSNGSGPASGETARIEGTYTGAGFTCADLQVAFGGSIAGTPDIVVEGDFTNDGTVNLIGGSLTMQGATLAGNSPMTLYSLIVDRATGVAVNADLTVTHSILLQSGDLNVGAGTLTLDLNSEAIGVIDRAGTGLSVTGQVTVRRQTTGGTGWRFYATPLTASVPFDDLDGDFTSGVPVYSYDESIVGDDYRSGWQVHTGPLLPGVGYIAFHGATQVDFTGSLQQTDFPTLPLDFTVTAAPEAQRGWHLVANPFPSVIDWDRVGLTNINGAVYVWDSNASAYRFWNAGAGDLTDGLIPPMTAFFLQTNAAGPSFLDLPASARAEASADYLNERLQTDQSVIRLRLDGEGFEASAFLRFEDGASERFDPQWDVRALFSMDEQAPDIAFRAEQELFSVHALSFDGTNALQAPMHFKAGKSGQYRLRFDRSGQAEFYETYLHDRLTGAFHELSAGSYAFTASEQDPEDRFELIAPQRVTALDPSASPSDFYAYVNGKELVVRHKGGNPDGARLVVYDVQGRLVATSDFEAGQTQKALDLSGQPSGMYLLTVAHATKRQTVKILLP